MTLTLYQVDAFAEKLFTGNPAAIVPLQEWIPESLMQNIAMENNLAETAFFVPRGNDYDIRWFTPMSEINLCGHATLASAFVLYTFLGSKANRLTFHSKSGPLYIHREGDFIFLDFPSWKPERVENYPDKLIRSLGDPEIAGVYKHRDYLVELLNEKAVRECRPDFIMMKTIGEQVIISAPGQVNSNTDFVSRFFAPNIGIDEDPVTGSSHSQLIPFWSYKLGKEKMNAKQLSMRGGELICEAKGERVLMGGKCVFYMRAEINV